MKKTVIYSFEKGDPRQLSVEFVSEAFGMLQNYALPGELDPEDPHPGYRAYRKIKGNMFSEDDLEAFASYMDVLAARAAERIAVLREERDADPRDEHSLKAYDGMIDMMETGRSMALRHMGDFMEAFDEENSALSHVPAM